MSHFSEADLADPSFATIQIDSFTKLRAEMFQNGLDVKLFHIANSAAVLSIPESHLDAVRPGIMLYGYSPVQKSEAVRRQPPISGEEIPVPYERSQMLVPVMKVKARLMSVRRLCAGTPISYARTFITARESLIGVLSVGYADGFSTKFSNNAEVLVKGQRAPVVGRVCMDLTMVDLTDVGGVTEDDEVVIIGRQGEESIGADDLARRIQTIPYESLTSLGGRGKKRYLQITPGVDSF
jgi:alanine racemase